MNKLSTNLTGNMSKAIIGLLVSCGAKAMAQNSVISSQDLIESNLHSEVIRQLVDEKILIRTQKVNEFILNNSKVVNIIQNSGNQELVQFMDWLKLVADTKSAIKIKKAIEMKFSTQDGGINQ